MENSKIVEDVLSSIERNDFAKAESYISKDMKVTGVVPQPLGADEFIGTMKALVAGIPNWKFNYRIGSESKNIVETKLRITGTHTREIPSPMPGVKNIAATNKTISMPEEKVTFTLNNNKIVNLKVEKVEGGGIPGLFKLLGVELPMEVHH
ncbi:MAG: ester cyclase [Ignavibacteriaceae bacterium]|nr:ester cyclase [Ignavibacteriaceae bacterium]